MRCGSLGSFLLIFWVKLKLPSCCDWLRKLSSFYALLVVLYHLEYLIDKKIAAKWRQVIGCFTSRNNCI